jgi:hypothetical protein
MSNYASFAAYLPEFQSVVQRGLCIEAKVEFYFGFSKKGSRENRRFFLLSC